MTWLKFTFTWYIIDCSIGFIWLQAKWRREKRRKKTNYIHVLILMPRHDCCCSKCYRKISSIFMTSLRIDCMKGLRFVRCPIRFAADSELKSRFQRYRGPATNSCVRNCMCIMLFALTVQLSIEIEAAEIDFQLWNVSGGCKITTLSIPSERTNSNRKITHKFFSNWSPLDCIDIYNSRISSRKTGRRRRYTKKKK